MKSDNDAAARLLSLPAADYFAFDEKRQLDLQAKLAELAGEADDEGAAPPDPILALGAPDSVDLEERGSVPLLVGSVQSGLRAWQVNFQGNLHVFLRNLDTGELSVAQPLIDLRRGQRPLPSGAGSRPEGLNAATVGSAVAWVDLRKKLGDTIAPGRFVVTATANELLSNSVSIRLEGKTPPPQGPLPAQQPYVRPEQEKGSHLETRVEVPAAVAAGAAADVRVSIQVRQEAGIRRAKTGEPFWPCHVILIKLDEPPIVVPVVAPVQEIPSADGGTVFNAVFRVDLRAASKERLAGEYHVYVDAGREFLGPWPLAASD